MRRCPVRRCPFERVLNAVVSHSHRDRETLPPRSGPSRASSRWRRTPACGSSPASSAPRWAPYRPPSAGRVPGRAGWLELCQHVALDYVTGARIVEMGARLRAGDHFLFLLSVPSRASGAVEPHHLVARLAAYARLGIRPGPADLGQALLRCGGGPADPDVVSAAEELELEEAPRVADWLRQGGLAPPRLAARARSRRTRAAQQAPGSTLRSPDPGRARGDRGPRALFRLFEPHICCAHASLPDGRDAHTVAAAPWHPEIAAARLLTGIASAAGQNGRGATASSRRRPRRLVPCLARRRGVPCTGRTRTPRQRGQVRCQAPRARQDPKETAWPSPTGLPPSPTRTATPPYGRWPNSARAAGWTGRCWAATSPSSCSWAP